ncbi:MarR family transcriptional regulator [Streptomyces antibioticus]|nr:MarR family transcriptional regulator [Streptomyces antibioticus]KUN29333.1 MarR family transcriptional regulator [Streptomyces antibioticus]
MEEQPPAQDRKPLTGDEEAFVRAYFRAMLTVPRALDADLLREQGMSMTEYVALMRLSEAPERWLRMGDLASGTFMSLSGMTRIVQRLESQGWVRREKSPVDGRGWNAILTDQGLKRLQQAWPTHLASVRSRILDHTADLDLPAVAAAMRRFAEDAECPSAEREE